uniref:RHO family interacting cell polarization regulator 1 n=1 Tax=Sander lucioperca TaxID=283035 RepID=A0A8C9ZFR8_SANLU
MSLSVRPARRLTSTSITRSQSFTGVNTHDKPYRNLSVFSTPGLSRKPSRASRMFTMSTKSNPPPKVPQPERLDQVYEALKKGLQSYLQVHQMDWDNLSREMKESKRNSRLVRLAWHCKLRSSLDRKMKCVPFSQIDELYEAYCLQRRLRDGANKMVKAYTGSQGSKEARESLAEANKGYKEYTENMCVLESELENQLGEFHIKMKGLAGFARLCAGDQYEIFMKYGRQRWKLRGRIEINAKQVWDSEEMVFVPLVSEFLCVKVTELKSLANHVVVGSVSCETKDLFAALPQTVAVDINDLGTIKLSLEVTWNPFDKDDQGSVASSVNKAPTVSKRLSTIFNQSPPDTPSLREQAFYNMLRRHDELENGTAWSNSSESSDDSSSPRLSVGGLRNSTHPKCLGMFGPLRCREMYALDRLLREARVLEIIRRIAKDNPRRIRQPVVGKLWYLGLYSGFVSIFHSAITVIKAMFQCLVERVLDQKLPRRNRDGVMVTLFQLWSYLEANSISDMETHITELAEEVWLVQSLASCEQDVIVHALRRPAECSLRREGLHAVAKLLKDPRGKVSASASSVLRSLTAQPRQREQALVSCLELLEDENVDTRVCGCKALACLKAKESIDQLVYLCRTDKDEVRDAAKQALLVLGEEGKMAHRHVETSQDSIPRLFAPGSMASTAF